MSSNLISAKVWKVTRRVWNLWIFNVPTDTRRSRREFFNESLIAKLGVDAAENGASEISRPTCLAGEFKKMNAWWCSQAAHAEERMCLLMAGKKTAGAKSAKGTMIMEVRKQYCAVEAHKTLPMCGPNMLPLKGMAGMGRL